MSGFERKKQKNGEVNPKYIDLCDEDPPLSGQKFACLSFVSPEKIIKQRETYLFDQFIKQWDMAKSMSKYFEFLHFISYKYSLNVENAIADFNDFVKENKLNSPITEKTKIVFISSKLPKPFVKSKVKFNCVINLGFGGVHYSIKNFVENHENLIFYTEKKSQKEFEFVLV